MKIKNRAAKKKILKNLFSTLSTTQNPSPAIFHIGLVIAMCLFIQDELRDARSYEIFNYLGKKENYEKTVNEVYAIAQEIRDEYKSNLTVN